MSVIPATWRDKHSGACNQTLQAANGTPITTYGTRDVLLQLGKHRYTARLIKADVKRPLLASDFIRHHNLLVDVRGQRLIEADTYSSVTCHVTSTHPDELALIGSDCNQFHRVLKEFSAILQLTFSCTLIFTWCQHYITTSGPPVHARSRRLSPDKLAVAKEESREMERMGIIWKLNSPWASPLYLVYLFVYLDDILIASSSEREHKSDIRTVCKLLNDFGLTTRLEKCTFGVKSINFLCHNITSSGSIPLPNKVNAITQFPKPQTIRSLQELLRMMNFDHRFVPSAATTL